MYYLRKEDVEDETVKRGYRRRDCENKMSKRRPSPNHHEKRCTHDDDERWKRKLAEKVEEDVEVEDKNKATVKKNVKEYSTPIC